MELSNNTDPDYDTEDNLNIKSFSLGNVLKKEIAPAKEDKAKVQNTSEFKNTCFHRLSRRKEKKGKKLKEMKEKEKQEATEINYFHELWKENVKKCYTNLFIRKLKQIIVPQNNFHHPLLEGQDKEKQFYQIGKINENLQKIWYIIIILQSLLVFFYATLGLAFEKVQKSSTTRSLSLICLIIQIVHILGKFLMESSLQNSARLHKVKFIQNLLKYLKSSFFYDLIIFLVLLIDSIGHFQAMKEIKIILIFKLFGAFDKIKKLQIVLIKNFYREQYWQLIKVFLLNFLFAHLLSVFLVLMAKIDSRNNWMTKINIQNLFWYQQYIWAYYWGTTIMLTVGFGDLTVNTTQQALSMIFIQMMSCILLTYNINSVGNILKSIGSYETEKQTKIKIFLRMQDRKPLSDHTKNKIMNYITQSADMKRKYNIEEEQNFISNLPEELTEQYHKQVNFGMFLNLPFFRNISEKFLNELALKIQRKLAHPEEIIFSYGKIPDIGVVNSGQISLNMSRPGHQSNGRKFQVLKIKNDENKLLSLYFLYNKQIKYDVKSCEYSVIYILKKQNFEEIIRTNPYNYQYYKMKQDRDRYNRNEMQTFQCILCGAKEMHTFYHCPKLHYLPINQLVIGKQKMNSREKSLKSARFLKSIRKIYKKQRHSALIDVYKKNNSREQCSEERLDTNLALTNFLTSISKKNNKLLKAEGNSVTLKELYIQLSQDIKEEISKVPLLLNEYKSFEWEIQCDILCDFQYYFVQDNPSNLTYKFDEIKEKISRKRVEQVQW